MIQDSESDDFSDSDYEEVDIENSGSDSSVCSLIEDDSSNDQIQRDSVLCAPVKEIPEVSQ